MELIDRQPVAAGRFYPDVPSKLKAEVDRYLKYSSRRLVRKDTFGIIVPHAGYVFSGNTAGACYGRLDKERAKRIVLIGSSHYCGFTGASVYSAGNYVTPLGIVSVDINACQALKNSNPLISYVADAHRQEHCLEVQLPFLQVKLGETFSIIPVVLGEVTREDCKSIANSLKLLDDGNTVFVVSTDLSHYPKYDDAVATDSETIDAIISGNPKHFINTLESNKGHGIRNLHTSCCGRSSVLTFLYLLKEKDIYLRKVDYSNSGDSIYGAHDRVVGYGGIEAVLASKDDILSVSEQDELMEIAFKSVEACLAGKKIEDKKEYSGGLNKKPGVFVSVYVNDKLRGCLGRFNVSTPLYRTVSDMAFSVLTNDKRFEPVTIDELWSLRIQISIISGLKKIFSPNEIDIGRHGVFIKQDFHTGTFLPEVAVKNSWNPVQFLEACSKHKAGIGPDGWKDAELYVYETNILDC